MYEVTYAGFTLTPESLKRLKEDKKYRLKINWMHFWKGIKYGRTWSFWFNFWNLILNRNYY